jgi:hypothetical protein
VANLLLTDFIGEHRDELIGRCQAKSGVRAPAQPLFLSHHGVPLFLSQLCEQLRNGGQRSQEISDSAKKHGHDLLLQGFTIDQVVHEYGDVCQAVTELAVELGAFISTDDFRTLNRCLDDAIAGAVTEFTLKQCASGGRQFVEVQTLANTAILAFEVIRTGRVGLGGSTGALLERSLFAIRSASAPSPEPKSLRKM